MLGSYLRWTIVLSRRVSSTELYVSCTKETRFKLWLLLAFMTTAWDDFIFFCHTTDYFNVWWQFWKVFIRHVKMKYYLLVFKCGSGSQWWTLDSSCGNFEPISIFQRCLAMNIYEYITFVHKYGVAE